VQIPSSGFPYWLFQALAIENGATLMNPEGTQTFYDKPEVVEALQYWVDLVKKYKVHPEGIVEWGTTPKDFFEKKVAMIWTTTGNLTNVRTNAKFDFGVAMLPAAKQRGSPTGGGNFYLFRKSTRAARGRVQVHQVGDEPAARGAMGDRHRVRRCARRRVGNPAMKQYVAGFPPAVVARDQLPFAKAELSTHDNQRVTKALNDGLQAALTGAKTPKDAMRDAQREAERLLREYR
jgi:sn-glycerol 3-phosphate transport system substrate-binding protein